MADGRQIDAGLQKRYGSAMPNAVWMQPLFLKIRNKITGRLEMLGEDMPNSKPAKRLTTMIQKYACFGT